MIIYKITNVINNKVYIGKTSNLDRRWYIHKLCVEKKVNQYLYDAMNHYGISNFIIEEIDQANDNAASEKEKYWILHYKSNIKDFGYNMTNGGDGVNSEFVKNLWKDKNYRERMVMMHKGRKHKKETIEKIRLWNVTNKKNSNETRRKISDAAKIRWASLEERKKQSNRCKGKIFSEEHKCKISQSSRGLKRSEETKNRISKGLKGRIFSEEHKRNLSEASKIREQKKRELKNENN